MKGPNGEKRPADVVSRAVMIARIATGEEEETGYIQPNRVKGGKAVGITRAKVLSKEVRKKIASNAAKARFYEEV